MKTKDSKILKTSKKKRYIAFKVSKIRLIADFSKI